MKSLKKILSISLISCGLLFTSCQLGAKEDIKVEVPDYSKYTDQFDFYGYSAANDGTYRIDNIQYSVGESFMTQEQYKMYKDAGMTIFFPQSMAPCGNEEQWNRSKLIIDDAVAAGLTKVIVNDGNISQLSKSEGSLIGPGCQFLTEQELDDYLFRTMQFYGGYPGVYGVMLGDEPFHKHLTAYTQVYKAIKRISTKYNWNLYIQYNLNPFSFAYDAPGKYYPIVEGEDFNTFEGIFECYKVYIKEYLDAMQPDYIQYDDYPMMTTNARSSVKEQFFPTLDFVSKEATARGIDFYIVSQTYQMEVRGTKQQRWINEKDARFLNNALLGFGIKQMSFFTYFTKQDNHTDGELFIDGASWVNRYGKKTEIYDFMQKILAENQKFAPTILQFKYQGCQVIDKKPYNNMQTYLNYLHTDHVFTALKSAEVNQEYAIVTELYDDENDNYMYMAMNAVDPLYEGSTAYETITLEFNSNYKYALVYRNGEGHYEKLENGKLIVKAAPGEASFVIPF